MPGSPLQLSRTPTEIERYPPLLGEHPVFDPVELHPLDLEPAVGRLEVVLRDDGGAVDSDPGKPRVTR